MANLSILDPISTSISAIGNPLAQVYTNRQNIKYAQQASTQERKWALEDFDRNNAYNHPAQQMERLREAGLNPHLVYGKGADNTAAMVRSSDVKVPNLAPLKFDRTDFQGILAQSAQIKQSQAQTDLLNEQKNLVIKEALNKDASTANILQNTASSKFQLEQAMRFKDLNYAKAVLENRNSLANLRKTISDTQLGKNRDSREQQALNAELKLKEVTTKNEAIKSDILSNDLIMRQFESALSEKGITKSDPWYYRVFASFVDAVDGDASAEAIMGGMGLAGLVSYALGKRKAKTNKKPMPAGEWNRRFNQQILKSKNYE